MPFRSRLPLLPALFLLPPPTPSQAEEITFYYQGALTQDGTLPAGCGGFVGAGTSFLGSLTFETTTPDVHPAPQQAIHERAIVASSLELLGVAYGHAGNGSMQFQDGYNVGGECGGALHDQLNFYPRVASPLCPGTFSLSITRIDCTGGLLGTATSMPTQPPAASFMPFQFRMARAGVELVGSITAMSLEPPTPVEPSTWGRIKRRMQ